MIAKLLSFVTPYLAWIKAGLAVAALAGAFWAGHAVTSNAWKADQAAQERAVRERYAEEAQAANARAEALERDLEASRKNVRTVTKYVDREVLQPIYSTECLRPRGVQLVNDAAAGRAPADSAESDGGVPGSAAPRGRDGSLNPANAH